MAEYLTQSGNVDRRTRQARELIGMTPTTEELLRDEVDGEVYSYKREYRCKVCMSDPDVARLIDTMLLYPKTYRETLEIATPLMDAKGIPPEKRPSYMSIRSHQKRHLPFDKLAVRQIAERRAADRGRAIIEGRDRLLTAEAVLELVVQRGWEQLVDREIVPSVQETMAAAMKLDTIEKASEGSLSLQGLLAQLNIILGAVRNNVPVEIWDRIVADIQRAKETMAISPASSIDESLPEAYSPD